MYLDRKGNKATVKAHVRYKNLSDYIGTLIDVYAAIRLERDFWLTDRERQFFIATVIHVTSGYINPICDESVQIYKDYFDPKVTKGKIPDYLNRLRAKNWLTYDKGTKKVEIASLLKDISMDSDMFDFNLRFLHEKRNQTDRSDNDGNQ